MSTEIIIGSILIGTGGYIAGWVSRYWYDRQYPTFLVVTPETFKEMLDSGEYEEYQ